jgi:hypothetical protein
MRPLESRTGEALAIIAAIEDQLKPGERSRTFLTRAAQRRLRADASGAGQLQVEDGTIGGYVCLQHGGHELYLKMPELACPAVTGLLEKGRSLMHLGSTRSGPERDTLHAGQAGLNGTDGWENSAQRLDPPSLQAAPRLAADAVTSELRGGQSIRSVQICEILTESAVSCGGASPCWSRSYGVEAKVTVTAGPATVSLSRYGTSWTSLDLQGLGRELAIASVGMSPASQRFRGSEVVLTPSAAGQLLHHVVNSLLIHPMTGATALCTAVVDDGRADHGYSARAHDCEGTPTGRIELVGTDGVQRPVATRHQAVPEGDDQARRLTGHARWDPLATYPQLSATNVTLAPTGNGGSWPAADGCIVVDVRSLGVERHRSGGHLAFRLQSARMVGGEPRAAFLPLSVAGDALDFLAAVVAVGPTVSFFPGPVSVGGSYLTMDLSRVMPRNSDLHGG